MRRLALTLSAALACAPGPATTTEDGSGTEPAASTGATGTSSGGLATTTLETTTMVETTGPTVASLATTTEEATTEPPPDLCEDHPAPDACCCFWADDGYHEVACPEPAELCAKVTIDCTSDADAPECPAGAVEVADAAALECALTQLGTAGVSGTLRYEVVSKSAPGTWLQAWDLYLQGDGTAYVRTLKATAAGGTYEPLARWTLGVPSAISKCKSDPDPVARIGCLRGALLDATEECVAATEVPGI
jgi:hypothetical protein